jgi:hypothetical protein
VWNDRGSVLIFTTALLIMLLAFLGLSIDLTYYMGAKGELQRSLDAAALAGAGKLGFNDTVFPDARNAAQQYGSFNGLHNVASGSSLVNLDLNGGNSATGDIVLGVWNQTTRSFAPSTQGDIVNAVLCQKTMPVQTMFLRLIGIGGLNVSSFSIAVSDQLRLPPPAAPCFPIGLSSCPFTSGEIFTSAGCGVPIKFITSNGKEDSGNTAAWVRLTGPGTPGASELRDAVAAAAAGNCPAAPSAGTSTIGSNGGMIASVFDDLKDAFVIKFNASRASGERIEVNGPDGTTATGYNGFGWVVYVPVIETTNCTPSGGVDGNINGDHRVTGWTRFVMTQMFDGTGKTKGCVVNNPDDRFMAPLCEDPPPALTKGSGRSVFGYYDCKRLPAPPLPEPAPRAALADKVRLVR